MHLAVLIFGILYSKNYKDRLELLEVIEENPVDIF